MDDAVLIMRLEFIATAVAAKIDARAVGKCGLGRIGRRCLHMHDCASGIRVKGRLGIVEIVVFVFKVVPGPRARLASGCKVGGCRTVFKTDTRDDGVVCKINLFRIERDGLVRRDICFP